MEQYGNTAPLGPVETTGSMIKDTFDKMISGLVNASDLAKMVKQELSQKVDELDRKVQEITAQLDEYRRRNAELDSLIHDIRRQRDEAESKLGMQASDLRNAIAANDDKDRRLNSLSAELQDTKDRLATTNKDRDDAEYRIIELTDILDKANAKLAKIKSLGAELFEDDPKPDGAKLATILPQGRNEGGQFQPHPVQTTEPVGFDWAKPYRWNTEKGEYENYEVTNAEPNPGPAF